MTELAFYLGAMLALGSFLIVTAALCVALVNPAPPVAGGKPEGYLKRVFVKFKEL